MGHADFEPKRNRLSAGVWGVRRQQMEWLTLPGLLVKFSKIILVTLIFFENFANTQIFIKWSEGESKISWGNFFRSIQVVFSRVSETY